MNKIKILIERHPDATFRVLTTLIGIVPILIGQVISPTLGSFMIMVVFTVALVGPDIRRDPTLLTPWVHFPGLALPNQLRRNITTTPSRQDIVTQPDKVLSNRELKRRTKAEKARQRQRNKHK